MDRQYVIDVINERLKDMLSKRRFHFERLDESFVRQIKSGRQSIGLALRNYGTDFELSLVVCIRIDEAERLFHIFSGVQTEYQQEGDTTITPLSYFSPSYNSFRLATPVDVISATDILSNLLITRIIPFLDTHQDAESLHVSVNLASPSIDITQIPYGPMQSIILAHLARSPDYAAIVTQHRTNMQLASTAKHPFNDLDNYIQSTAVSG